MGYFVEIGAIFFFYYNPFYIQEVTKQNVTKVEGSEHFLEELSAEQEEDIGTVLFAERWCCLSSLLGYWTQSWTGRHSDTGYLYLQAGTHFANLRRMTGRVNPTWY